MKASMKQFIGGWLLSCILALGFTLGTSVLAADTNRLETGGNYNIMPPPSNMMAKITANAPIGGDNNLVWSHSGRYISVDRYDSSRNPPTNQFINVLGVANLAAVQDLGPRSSATNNWLMALITDWTWNDDRILFSWWPRTPAVTNPPFSRIMAASSTGAMAVTSFLWDTNSPGANYHVLSPSVVYDPFVGQERLLFLASYSLPQSDPQDVMIQTNQLYTVTYPTGGTPAWGTRVRLSNFTNNLQIISARWCPELGTNYQPLVNRYAVICNNPGIPTRSLYVFTGVQDILAGSATAPSNFNDPRFIRVAGNVDGGSQMSWTYDGQTLMFAKTNNAGITNLFTVKSTDTNSSTLAEFPVPGDIANSNKKWLAISPNGMKAAFTVNMQVYVIPMQFDNAAVTGAVVTNVLTDASYTAVDVPGEALPSNTTFSIVEPSSVDTNNFNGEFAGYAREFSVSGVSSQFNLETNAQMTLHFSESDIPSGVSTTNLAIYVYNPQGTNAGQTGSWDQLTSMIDTNSMTISAEVQHFSIYAIGRASAEPEGPPAVPTGVAASKGTHKDKVRIEWNWAAGVTSYEVWRHTANDSSAATKFATEPATNSYNDVTAVVGTLYYYWVKAKNAAGTSGFSGSDSGYARGDYTVLTSDYDGDRKADPALYVEAEGAWYVKLSGMNYGLVTLPFGGAGRAAVNGDFDGDGKADPAIYTEATGQWQVQLSGSGYGVATLSGFGGAGYTPVAGDYDGDGKADPAIYNTASGDWQVAMSSQGYGIASALGFGGPDFTAIPENYDSDHRFDVAVYDTAAGNWWIMLSLQNYITATVWGFGGAGYDPVMGDFDGDGLADPAIYAEATGLWQVKLSGSGYGTATLSGFGGTGTIVAAADYDQDAKADPIYLDGVTGVWHVKLSASGYAEATLASGWTP